MPSMKASLVTASIATALLLPTPAFASTYTVQPGDDLWSVAQKTLGDGDRWPEIARLNNLYSPRVIHRGNILELPEQAQGRADQATNLLSNGNFETEDYGSINTWADRQLELGRWYLGYNYGEKRTTEWVKYATIGETAPGHGIQVDDYSVCDAWCSVSVTQQVPAEPGASYTLTARAKILSGNGASLYLEFLNEYRNHIHIETTGTPVVGEWQTLSTTYTAPPGTKYISARLYSSNTAEGTKLWDDVRLVKN